MEVKTAAALIFSALAAVACSRTGGNAIGGAGRGGAGGLMAAGGMGGTGGAGGTDAEVDSRICALSGHFTAVSQNGSCPPVSELGKYSPNNNLVYFLGIYSDGSNAALPKCADRSPYNGGFRFRFRVDQVTLGSHTVNTSGTETLVFDSALHGADVDANPACGMGVFLNSISEQVSVAPGRVLVAAQRTVVRSDYDQPAAYVLYDENGMVLYAYASSLRIDRFASDLGDLFSGLGISSSNDVICRVPDADMSLISARLSTGSDFCDIDSHSERCCMLWGRTYEAQMIAALGPTASQPYSTISFTLRTPGFFVKAQQ